MKILFVTPWYPYPASINHGIFIQDQARVLAQEHEVVVLAAEVNYEKFGLISFTNDVSKNDNVTEHRITIRRSLPFFNQIIYLLLPIWYGIRLTATFKPDIIHGNIGYPGAFWSWALGVIRRKPFLITEHTGNFKGHFRSWWHKKLSVFTIRKASMVIAVSTFTADQIFINTGKRAIVIGNIIDFTRFVPPPRANHRPARMGFLGNMGNDNKGLGFLLAVLASVNKDYVLHIGGSGRHLEKFKALAVELRIDSKCIFHGFVAHYDVPDFLTSVDFMVSASPVESFGMVLVEAMAMGLPVIATDSGGPRDFINKDNGVIVAAGDHHGFKSAIEKMIDEYNIYDAQKIRQGAMDNFSVDPFLSKMNACYKSITTESKRG